jgi:hypothetical protein
VSAWNHSICDSCWTKNFSSREPVRIKDAQIETCCFCLGKTASGIFVRNDPRITLCRGNHADTLQTEAADA